LAALSKPPGWLVPARVGRDSELRLTEKVSARVTIGAFEHEGGL
jgi:hypothetical protein